MRSGLPTCTLHGSANEVESSSMPADPDKSILRWLVSQVERKFSIAILAVSVFCTAGNIVAHSYEYFWRPRRNWLWILNDQCTEILWFMVVAGAVAVISPRIRRGWLIYLAIAIALVGIFVFGPSQMARE